MSGCRSTPTPIGSQPAAALELVIFTPTQGVDPAGVALAGLSIEPVLREQPGFIGRTLARADDGQFVDAVNWASIAEAESAATAVTSNPALQARVAPFFSQIDQIAHFEMSHSDIVVRDSVRPSATPHVLELVRLREAQEVDRAVFLARAREAAGKLQSIDGLVAHQLSVDSSGRFVHLVAWESMDKALAAQTKAMTIPAVVAWFELMDPSSVSVMHYRICR
jgi:heme-degrading monooxygenase HmoA